MGFRRNMTEALELPKEILLHLPLISFIGQEEVTIENYKAAFGGVHGGDGQSGKNGISAMSIRAGHWGEDFVPSVMVLFMWIC